VGILAVGEEVKDGLRTAAPTGGESDAAEPFEPIELEQRARVTMPGGWKMSQLQAEQPATTYAEFNRKPTGSVAAEERRHKLVARGRATVGATSSRDPSGL
jgi:hypothetical protein